MKPDKDERIDKAVEYFSEGYACSQSIALAFSEEYNLNKEILLALSSTFGGGMGRLRKTCGALTGAFMILGLKYGNTNPLDMDKKLDAYRKVRELTGKFEAIYETSQCKQLLKNHTTKEQVKERKHHKIICTEVVKTVAELLAEYVQSPPAPSARGQGTNYFFKCSTLCGHEN